MNISSDKVLALGVSQPQYDAVSMNRKSTFINLYDINDEYVVSANTLEMKSGSDFLFLAEVLRAAELNNLIEVNSLCEYKGLKFRLGAVQTSELNTTLKQNIARKEDWKKASQNPQPAPQQQPIQVF